mgnify:CR=1 FL=1
MNDVIYEILVRGNTNGSFAGGHVIYYGNPLPQSLDVLVGGNIPAWLQTVGTIASTSQQLQIALLESRNAEITKKIAQLAPDLSLILDRLLNAGLTAWADRAMTNYNLRHPAESDSITPLVAQLYSAAIANDIQLVLQLFGEVLTQSQVTPTNQESIAMQSILTEVQFPAELMNFNQWIN